MNVSAIILAAGQSKRFGRENKLLSSYKGTRLIDHCLNTILATKFNDRILVTGHEALKIEPMVKNLPIRAVFNSNYLNGMGASLAVGVDALKPSCEAFMVFLADMPDISPNLCNRLLEVHAGTSDGHSIVRPTYRGQPGHPVLFSAKHIETLSKLAGDQGAGAHLSQNSAQTLNVPVRAHGCIYDIDK